MVYFAYIFLFRYPKRFLKQIGLSPVIVVSWLIIAVYVIIWIQRHLQNIVFYRLIGSHLPVFIDL